MEHHLPPWAPHITMVTLCKLQETHFPHPRQIAFHLDHLMCTILHPLKSHSLDIAHSNNHQWAKTFLLQLVPLIDPLYSLFSLITLIIELAFLSKNIFHSHTYHGAWERETEMQREMWIMMHLLTHWILWFCCNIWAWGPHGQPQSHVNELSRLCHESMGQCGKSWQRERGSSCKVTVDPCGFSSKNQMEWLIFLFIFYITSWFFKPVKSSAIHVLAHMHVR